MKLIVKIVFGWMLFVLFSQVFAATAYSPSCPPKISVEQKLITSISNWRLFVEDQGQGQDVGFVAVRLFDGEPEQRADLIPDSQKPQTIWRFNPSHKIFLVCVYNNTSVQLTQPLREHTSQCVVTYFKNQSTFWGKLPKRIDCK